MTFAVPTAEKHMENLGNSSVEKIGQNGAFFGALFGVIFGAFFGEQLFALKSENSQNPFCKRDPFIQCVEQKIESCLTTVLKT